MHGVTNPSFDTDDVEDKNGVELVGVYPFNAETDTASVTVYQNAAAQVAAVSIRNGEKSYKGRGGKTASVIKGFNMTLPKGSIYSLLGSSGCGKTTVLKAIVGVQHLDSGDVSVFGEIPGSKAYGNPRQLGYMPQETALYEDFTIGEMLAYFGKIFTIPRMQIEERSEFLIRLLQLPDSSRKIGTLSGGQQRRVSFAVALVHKPSLLILDEPTVGVDPLLRQSIWKYLRQLVTEFKTTVLITTHYIEETRQSDIIGVMRNGKLLVEKHPLSLLEQFNQEFLEDVVLHLCQSDDEIPNLKDDSTDTNTSSTSFPAIPYSESETLEKDKKAHDPSDSIQETSGPSTALLHVQATISKTLTLYTRNLPFLIFSLVFPISQVVVCAICVGNKPVNPNFGVVNFDSKNENCSFFSKLNYSMGECSQEDLSCHYLSRIPPDELNIINFANVEEAREAVTLGNTWGYMEFPENYSTSFYNIQLTQDVGNLTNGKYSHVIDFKMDMSLKLVTQFLQKMFFETYEKFVSDYKVSCDYDKRVGQVPLKLDDPVIGHNKVDFREFVLIGTMTITMFCFPMISSSFWFIFDKKQGIQTRAIVAGVKTWEMLLGSYVVESVMTASQIIMTFIAIKVIVGVDINGSVILAFALCLLMGFCGVLMGFVITTFCSEEFHVGISVMGLFLPNFLLAGLIWSHKAMPTFLQYITTLAPGTLPAEALRTIVNRSGGFFHPHVWPGFLLMLVYAIIFCAFTIIIHHRRNNSPVLKTRINVNDRNKDNELRNGGA